jgi:LPS-assembly lipoprotein
MYTKATSLLIIFFFLTACGYQLRGAVELPEGMENLYLENASGQLRDEIRKALKFSKGKLVSSPKEAGIVIKILKEEMRTRVLSLSATGKANQFELLYNLIFSIYDPSGKLLLGNQRVQSQRSYFNDQEEVLAQTNEEQLIRNEMYSQAVRSIVIRSRIAMENSRKESIKKTKETPPKKKVVE